VKIIKKDIDNNAATVNKAERENAVILFCTSKLLRIILLRVRQIRITNSLELLSLACQVLAIMPLVAILEELPSNFSLFK
jgi:hypothetical protein